MKQNPRRPDGHRGDISSADLAADLEITLNRIDKTINQLASKMNPKSIGSEIGAYLVDSLEHFEIGDIRRIASRTADRTGQVIKDHPVPVLLGCLAVASFFLPREWHSARRKEEEIQGRLRSAAGAAAATASATAERLTSAATREAEALARTARSTGHAVSEYAGQGVEKLDELAHRASDRIAEAAHKTADVARDSSARLRSAASDTAENHPLGMALGALAVGFLTALVIPRSRKEENLMGDTADSVREYVKGVGSAIAHDAKEMLHENDLDPEGLQKRAVRAIDRATSRTRRGIEDHLDR
jgi:gas vesicle protein